MKKFIIIGVVVVIALILAGVGYKLATNTASKVMHQAATTANPLTNLFAAAVSVQCSFTDDQGKRTTAFIKAGNVRADMMSEDTSSPYNNGSIIIKDKKIYFWTNDKKQGFMMDLPVVTVTPGAVTPKEGSSSASSNNQGANMMETLEKYKEDCKNASIGDEEFVPPTDVKFQDMSTAMHSMMPSGIPSGVPTQYMQYMHQTPSIPQQ